MDNRCYSNSIVNVTQKASEMTNPEIIYNPFTAIENIIERYIYFQNGFVKIKYIYDCYAKRTRVCGNAFRISTASVRCL